MAIVKWSAGIDYVSGALSKPKKDGQHKHEKMLLGTHRKAATSNPNCTRVYMRDLVERSTEPTQNELAARTRFTAVQAAVNTRMKNLSTIATDREAFEAQKDLAGGKKTLKSYLWKVCGDAYDAQNG